MRKKKNHISETSEIFNTIPKVLDAQLHIWQMESVKQKRKCGCSLEHFQEITAGGQCLLLSALTSQSLEQQLSPLLEGIYGCRWYGRTD